MNRTPVGDAIGTDALEAMRMVAARFWAEWGSRYPRLSPGRQEALQAELNLLLEQARGNAVITHAPGWEVVSFPPNASPGLDRPMPSCASQTDDSGNLLEILWWKSGPDVTDWIQLGGTVTPTPAGPVYNTAVEMDFTQLSGDLTDGSNTVPYGTGKTCNLIGAHASHAQTFRFDSVTNQGLIVTTTTTGGEIVDDTLPNLSLPLAQFLPAAHPRLDLLDEIWLWFCIRHPYNHRDGVGEVGSVEYFGGTVCGVETSPHGSYYIRSYCCANNYGCTPPNAFSMVGIANHSGSWQYGGHSNVGDPSTTNTDDVFVVRLSRQGGVTYYSGQAAWSNPNGVPIDRDPHLIDGLTYLFPSRSDLKLIGGGLFQGVNTGVWRSGLVGAGNALAALFGCAEKPSQNISNDVRVAVFRRFRFEYVLGGGGGSGGSGGAASYLATTGDGVGIVSAPPAIGQTLVADSPTSAHWGDPEDGFESAASSSGLVTLTTKLRNVLVAGSEALTGLSTTGMAAGALRRLHFLSDRSVTSGAIVAAGFAPFRLEKQGASTYQDFGVIADGVLTFQLRTDGSSPFWKLIGGSFA